jgi:hypothetical protein
MHLCVADVGITISNFISEPEVLKCTKAPAVFGNSLFYYFYLFICMCCSLYAPRLLKEVAELFCTEW